MPPELLITPQIDRDAIIESDKELVRIVLENLIDNAIKFYNDSKATSVDATLKALEAFANEVGQVVLILGGKGKKAPAAPFLNEMTIIDAIEPAGMVMGSVRRPEAQTRLQA